MPGWINGLSAIEADGVFAIAEGDTFGQSNDVNKDVFALNTLALQRARQT